MLTVHRVSFKSMVPGVGNVPYTTDVVMPAAAQILRLDMNTRSTTIYYLCDTKRGQVVRRLQFVTTGDEVPFGSIYLGTADLSIPHVSGTVAVHVFDLGEMAR